MRVPTNATKFLDISKQVKGKNSNKQQENPKWYVSPKKRMILTESMYTSSIQSAKGEYDLKQIRVYFLYQAVIN